MSSDAAKRAAARRAKIMARGNAGSAKLAQTARGEEAQKSYGDEINAPAVSTSTDNAPSATASTTASESQPTQSASAATTSAPKPTTATSSSTARSSDAGRSSAPSTASRNKPSWAADPTAASGAVTPSEAEDQARQQMEAMMAMSGGGPSGPGGAGGQGEMPDMASMFAQMMQGMQQAQGGGADGEMPNPFAASQGMGGGAGGMPPFPGMGGMGGMPGMPGIESPPSKAARRFPLLHASVIIALIVFIAVWWEPNLHMVRAGDLAARTAGDWARRWSGLAGAVGNTSMVEKSPVFWAFVTLEVLLFSTRTTFIRSGSGSHPLLANFVPMSPPAAQSAVRAAGKASPALMQTYRDGCSFFFGSGMAVVAAEWKAGYFKKD